MEMENEKTKNMETDIYLCLMEFDNKEVDSYSYVTDGLGMVLKYGPVCTSQNCVCLQKHLSTGSHF